MVEYGLKCGLTYAVFSYSQPVPAIARMKIYFLRRTKTDSVDHEDETVLKRRMSYLFLSRCPKASASDNPPSPNGNCNRIHV